MTLLDRLSTKLFTARTLLEAGFVQPMMPDRVLRLVSILHRYGPTAAAGYASQALRQPHATAIVDEAGTLTFEQVQHRTNALARALAARGVRVGDGVAVMCRNHRGWVETTVALSKLGAHALYLNTQFAGPQIADVIAREDPVAIVYDEEFAGLIGDAGEGRRCYVAWHDADAEHPTLDELIAEGDPSDLPPPAEKGRTVILTSGTTGTPKGANRSQPESLDPIAGFISKIPLRGRERTVIAAPLFHSWGYAHFALAMGLGSTIVLKRKFDEEATLALVAEHRATALVVVPVMLQRILGLDREVIARHDVSSLRIIAASGSALPGPLAEQVMDTFGDVLYNLYGSTEVAWATIATPADLRAAPGCAGRAPRGTVVRLLDDEGRPVPQGQTGRIFVANELVFEGYTGGGGKAVVDGLMSTGDVGHFDVGGRLFVDGRDDEMIVSGGENVFPAEIEDTLAGHDAIAEVAAIGVDDEQFGQRLRAFVVLREGAALTEADAKQHVKSQLAGYKVPREVIFLDEMPRNATGKILKRVLREHQV